MSFAYNAATWIMTIIIVAMLVFIAVEFKQGGRPNESANFPGHDYEGRISDGLKSSDGIRAREYK